MSNENKTICSTDWILPEEQFQMKFYLNVSKFDKICERLIGQNVRSVVWHKFYGCKLVPCAFIFKIKMCN